MTVTIRGSSREIVRYRSNYLHCRHCKTRAGILVLIDKAVDRRSVWAVCSTCHRDWAASTGPGLHALKH